jgi:hypothetical protein
VTIEEIQAAYYMVAATGVLVAAFYYVYNIRNTTKTRELQVTMQVLSLFSNKDFWKEYKELMLKEWNSVDEYYDKFGKGMTSSIVFPTFEEIGVLLKRKLIDVSVPWDLYGNATILAWEKYSPVLIDQRKISSDNALWTEYLVNEVKAYTAKHPGSQIFPK